jgi:hypothetical protein
LQILGNFVVLILNDECLTTNSQVKNLKNINSVTTRDVDILVQYNGRYKKFKAKPVPVFMDLNAPHLFIHYILSSNILVNS